MRLPVVSFEGEISLILFAAFSPKIVLPAASQQSMFAFSHVVNGVSVWLFRMKLRTMH
jgi:hypothetical protein